MSPTGVQRIMNDIRFMLGFGVGIYWKATWAIIIPIGLLSIFIYAMVQYQPMKTDNGEFYPVGITGIQTRPSYSASFIKIYLYKNKGVL